MESTKRKIIGSCPCCGGNVVKIRSGYRCENSILDNNDCKFNMSSLIANRRISDAEAETLIKFKEILLDGFSTKDGKVFSTVLRLNPDGTVNMESLIAVCPICGGNIHVSSRSFYCSNFSRQENPCNFTIWRNIAGHPVTLDEARQICAGGCTAEPVEVFNENGDMTINKLGLNPDKTKIIPL